MTKSVLFYLELTLLLGRMSLVAYGDSSSDSEVDEGGGPEENKNSDVRKLLGLLPPPKGNKSKQPVRIALPTIKSTVRLFCQCMECGTTVLMNGHVLLPYRMILMMKRSHHKQKDQRW